MRQVLVTRGGVEVRDVPAPQVQPGTVLVRVSYSCISTGTEMSSIRESDTPLWKRAMQRPEQVRRLAGVAMKEGLDVARAVVRTKLGEAQPVGYSAVGHVIEVGEGTSDVAIGGRVACAGAANAYHADYICVPRNLCVAVPQAVSDTDAATVTIGAIALQGVRRLAPTLGESVVVIGLGAIGQITTQLLRSAGVHVIGVDIDRKRLAEATAAGLDAAIHPDDADPAEQAVRLTDGVGADGVIVTAASPSDDVLSTAFRICRRKARVVLVGDVGLDIKRADIYHKELDFLISTSYGPGRYDRRYEEEGLDYPISYVRWTENRNMAEYLRQIADGRVRLEGMPSAVFPVERAADAYAALADAAQRPLNAFLDYERNPAQPVSRRLELRNTRVPVVGAIRVAVIGAGKFAKSTHLPLLQRMSGDFAVHAIVGRRGHEAATLAAQYGAVVAATDPGAILGDPNVDAVLIATRHDNHADLVVKALEAGKHVLVEKPLCVTPAELDRISSVVERLGDRCPVLMTGFNRRFSVHSDAVKALIDTRSNPFIVNYRVNAGYIPLDHWVHGTQGGGRNIGEACHFYDLFVHLAGSKSLSVEARAIQPVTAAFARNDNFCAVIGFADGSVANLIYTALGSSGVPKESIDLYCDGKILRIVDFESFTAVGCKAKPLRQTDKGYASELAAFARGVRGETPWPIPFWQQAEAMTIAFNVETRLRAGMSA